MHIYKLTYEYFGETITKSGNAAERFDAHELLFKLLESEGKAFMLEKNSGGDAGYKKSLELTRYKNVRAIWL
ncbi:hypothetical protein PS914_05958 [Pseudomonas fluorescens]|uniref:hypothetical protein n=1 Tax=Pseudomonas fluorescens TaxID=294 RepID=UPI001241C831|nr:hypothetical protein [Pseudomonas fluorescens]VVQ17096.1 hypothetical protein PS914_05958 [Pseudomonas fluorescens]